MDDPILMLAEYLTGPEVGHHSIALKLPVTGGPMKLRERADRFFALREAFGVEGYDSAAAAEQKIQRAIRRAEHE
jgi:hypothetical protein